MASFKALNIESDDESDVEIDDTKEIQIEEALKLYQNALRYHSEGPDSFDKAAEAYRLLFESEIFKYPESQAELRYIELYGTSPETDESWDEVIRGSVIPTGSLETGPSTLPQILHLSHKNYAQFRLEALIARFDTFNITLNQILADATAALDHFVHALDKDDTDLDLWRRAACVGEVLHSKRVARFCLESVLDGDDEGLNGILAMPGLEESLAGEHLRTLVRDLQDHLSVLQAPLPASKRRVLSKILRQRLHPYEGLIRREKSLRHDVKQLQEQSEPQQIFLKAPTSWAELGEALVMQQNAEHHGTIPARSGAALAFDIDEHLIDLPQALDQATRESHVEMSPAPDVAVPLSSRIQDQFIGLDSGLPTVQPHTAAASNDEQPTAISAGDTDGSIPVESPSVTLPSRKRSGESAGLVDGQEEGRTKSRRIRARDSNVDPVDSRQAIIEANIRWEYEQQLNEFQAADDWMFETVGNLFERVNIVGFDAARHVRQDLHGSGNEESTLPFDSDSGLSALRHARSDIQAFLDNFNDQLAHLLLHGGEDFDLIANTSSTGASGVFTTGGATKNVTKVPIMPNDGLKELLLDVSKRWMLTNEVNWAFLQCLLRPRVINRDSAYAKYLWPENLKTMVVRNLVNFDSSIYEQASANVYDSQKGTVAKGSALNDDSLVELVQTIFELHLDIYCLIKQKNSGVDEETITSQGDRLQRWSDLSRETMQLRSAGRDPPEQLTDSLSIRFLWATTFFIGATDDASQEHTIECMHDLRSLLVLAGQPIIRLQNNAIMPELSLAALDQEMSKLTTRDFFARVTDQEKSDPAALIESLEPFLELLESNDPHQGNITSNASQTPSMSDTSQELVRFLRNSDLSVRLKLWQRLKEAYRDIEYEPMVVYCYFRMIHIVLGELKSPSFVDLAQAERQVSLMKSLRLLQEIIKKIYTAIQDAADATECIDAIGLQSAVLDLGDILQIVQVFSVNEDTVRVGQSQPPSLPNGMPNASWTAVNAAIHDTQLRIWTILYALLKEAMSQNKELFSTPTEDRFDFLRTVHRNLGLRKICGGCNRAFVRLLKNEFFQMTHVDGYDSEQAQVLYDLYGLNCFLNPSYELMEHDCTRDAFIERSVALQSVDLLLAQASKLSIKDLVKHVLKDTIDRVHGALARKKPTEAILRNRDVYRAFLRSPINPLDLFNCITGEGSQLLLSPIPKEDALLASKGWYFLMGHMALTRFRSQKRTAPTPTEDVDIAIAFFMQDLEATMEHWETWFRLAQAYDTKIEENVVWSAEKINNNMTEITSLQRAAIHCYTIAAALAHRSADLAFETSSKMTELYADFALRLYSSSREPFSMLPFAVDESEKFISTSTGLDKLKHFQPLGVYTAWKLALAFFKKALAGRPDQWTIHYMIGKCMAKMHHADEAIRRHNKPPTGAQVLQAFIKALELLPDKDKKGDSKREPVLEPHYKLVSVVHKLVLAKSIDLPQAIEALQHTQYATRDPFPESLDEWTPYVLAVMKHLRIADKSHWYHRMIARAAHIIYEDSGDTASSDQNLAAMGAKHELTQQMFTKTMVLQVWRPETERAGRHFVYTARYTRLFVQILKQLKDRAGLEMLARRVRRRTHDMFEHGLVWQETCNAYLQLLRASAELSEGLETSIFSNIAHDDFLIRKEPLEKWMQSQPQGASRALDVLRDVQELKKVNQGLMKPGVIDDLIGDSYAYLFNTIGKQLLDEERRIKEEEEARRPPPPPPVPSPPRNPMMSLTHLMNNDSSSDTNSTPQPQAVIPAPSNQPDQPPIRRKIGVGRREIRTCAESCYPKGTAQNAVGVRNNTTGSNSRIQSLLEDNQQQNAGDTSVDTSAPASIHDSADESELSELEEEEDEEDGDGDGGEDRDRSGDVDGVESEPARSGAETTRRPTFPGLTSITQPEQADVSDGGFETADEEPQQKSNDTEMELAENGEAEEQLEDTAKAQDEQGDDS